ncbi:uncharacterized protein LOC127806623 [Diospyros lotus]|uniref:uncharacterized protein LOC127806623 n=1 Tax=Diospyros lotus TaxID=55363 RepID=UPI0022589D8F|nr:uncharacterized protein LOC127806623 [Diospyros lotus]
MADFPPNLDDGELWLPSDIFPEEAAFRRRLQPPPPPPPPPPLSNRPQHFAALSFLDPNRPAPTQNLVKHCPPPQCFRSPVRYGPAAASPAEHFSLNGTGLRSHRAEALWTGSRPVQQYHFLSPVRPQVESFGETGFGFLQRQQQSRVLQNRVLQSKLCPFHGTGGFAVAAGRGGFARECSGTGVFLPRIAAEKPPAAAASRKRQSLSHNALRNPIKVVGVVKQGEGCQRQLPPDVGLPQDWTY